MQSHHPASHACDEGSALREQVCDLKAPYLTVAREGLGFLLAQVEFLSRGLEQRCLELEQLVRDPLPSVTDSSNDFVKVVGHGDFLRFLHILIHIVL